MRKALLIFALLLAGCSSKGGGASKAASTGAVPAASIPVAASAQLNWTASTGAASGYYVEQSSDAINFSLVKTVTNNNALVSNLNVGSTYFFRVRAYNSGGYSAYSPTITVQP